jgi:hypothetical protein
MQKNLIIVLLALILGSLLGAFLHKKFTKKGPESVAIFEEIIEQRKLHLIKHIYQDICYIHRKNDTRKAIKAIAIIPVSISAFVDLEKMEIQMAGDSVKSILLPPPEIDDPNYQVDSMKVIQVKSALIHIGKDLYTKVTEQIRDIVQERKREVLETSSQYDILGQTRTEAIEYFTSLLKNLNMGHVEVSFSDQQDAAAPQAKPRMVPKAPPMQPALISVDFDFGE